MINKMKLMFNLEICCIEIEAFKMFATDFSSLLSPSLVHIQLEIQ